MHWPAFFIIFSLFALAAPQVLLRRRQVVTPTWLMGPSRPNSKAGAPKVQVTQQNLREVAAWRAVIQKAVDEGTYVVAAPPPQEFIASLGGSFPSPLPQFWAPAPIPAFNFTYIWPRFG
ncbi:hypothetical protein KR059_011185 [Drosophila kikkawai]|nr:hypothetical protein KR059_011185 [Drosophila kikkawai]